ncbi:S8 family serine peptidase [Nitrosopumilus sp. K4]|uniref:S8 family serine peptidase n=1 Tax=Nitrosopumilus sp. K4 TaxID=2795383 RepID=UPI001BAB2D77|nr:S8 family serine peptidase [Nitrosopumilus sp. K4]QUC64111.1 S8 family serine peptidase [Nitrosopumilus sp. K4]
MKQVVIFSLIILVSSILLVSQFLESEHIGVYLDKSVPFVGTEIPRNQGIFGEGVKIAVIDTGVDFNHPDLLGWGPDGKVIGGYNFINEDQLPLDTNGHGTQVAGIIAADGKVKGVAPKAKILAYKVSEDGEGVSSDLIIQAIDMAIEDGADIINISLGVNKTNASIDSAVSRALDREIFVVAAAGNDGPSYKTIGSPGKTLGSVTVGATYNNLTSSLVATLDVGEKPYTVIPMVGSTKLDDPVQGKIIFGGYGKESDLKDKDVKDSILLVERGSDVKGELLYFSIKEENAANAGAKAMIVYNNEPGIFLGELTHNFTKPGYTPRIPVVSIDRDDGLEIKESKDKDASLHLFYNPDFVAHFSSRGPVSPFFIKPDMVAPGAYINTTQSNSAYNFTSGTSYAAPHVSGAAALLLEKNPQIHHHEIRSLLMTTSEPVSDAYGKQFSLSDAGSGRLNIAKAFEADLVILPPNFVVNVSSDNPTAKQEFDLKLLGGSDTIFDKIDVAFEGPEFIQFAHVIEGNTLQAKLNVNGEEYGDHEGKMIIKHNGITYVVPFLMHYTLGSVSVTQQDGKLSFDVYHPEEWNFAKISITNSRDGRIDVTTATPTRDALIDVFENAEYWVDAKIRVNGETFDAFNVIQVNSVTNEKQQFELFKIPQKQVGIIAVIVAIVGVVGLAIRRKSIVEV